MPNQMKQNAHKGGKELRFEFKPILLNISLSTILEYRNINLWISWVTDLTQKKNSVKSTW